MVNGGLDAYILMQILDKIFSLQNEKIAVGKAELNYA